MYVSSVCACGSAFEMEGEHVDDRDLLLSYLNRFASSHEKCGYMASPIDVYKEQYLDL